MQSRRTSSRGRYGNAVLRTETLQVSGIRCERCVLRLGKALEGHDGLEFANANLMGQVELHYDEERTSLDALLEKMAGAGFRPIR
jgi:copper chaperone CopZ